MTDGFLSRLDQVQQNYQSQKERLDASIKASEEELVNIASTLRKLEQQSIEVGRRKYQALEAGRGLTNDRQEETLELVFSEFNTFQRFMAAYLEQNFGVREELQRQLEGLLAQDPLLEDDLAEYHAFLEKAELAYQSLPAFYRKTFEQAIQLQAQRLKRCLDLEAKLQSIPSGSDGIVPVVMTFDQSHSQMFWALPAASQTEGQDGTFSQRMDGLENAFIQFLTLLAKDPDWTLLDIERDVWAGFRSLTTLVEYTGPTSIREAVQEYLAQRLTETWPFKNLTPIPEIAELDWDTWQLGQTRSGALLDLKAVQPVVEEPAVTMEPTAVSEEPAYAPLFTQKDIIAWERPLRVAEDSAWTVSARRLRTLLMRLASQGRIGKDGVYPEQILGGLPKDHAVSFEKLFPVLIETGVLREETNNGNSTLSLNPERLADVQDLITRDVTPFWVPLVA